MNATPPDGPQEDAKSGVAGTRPILSLAMLLAGSLLVGFSMGSWLAPPAAWIGPVLIMRYARDHTVGRGYLLVLVACMLSMAIGFGAMWTSAGWPLPLVVSLPALYGFLWSLPYLADRLMSRRLPGFSSTLVYPLAAASLEFVNTSTNPIGAWGATGFTQYGQLQLMQLASVTGMIGITFLMGWFASVANWAWENRAQGARLRTGLAGFGVVLVAVFVFGVLRLGPAPLGETVRVAGITADPSRELSQRLEAASDAAAIRAEIQSHWDAYFEETAREARAGAKVVVWPEVSGVAGSSDEASSLVAQAQDVAREHAVYLAIGLFVEHRDTGEPTENKFLLFDPTGTIVIDHVKYGGAIIEGNRLIGDGSLQTATTPFGVLSGVICWDADYPEVIQQTGQNGTGMLLVPSSDWAEIDPIHTQMAVFRAIENGMSLVRQVEGNLSIAVDPYGRVLGQTDYFASTDRTMVAQVPVEDVPTLYSSFGRWLGLACVAGFLLLVALVVARAWTARRGAGT
jgi:apolipoprotein N-acyltransferase